MGMATATAMEMDIQHHVHQLLQVSMVPHQPVIIKIEYKMLT